MKSNIFLTTSLMLIFISCINSNKEKDNITNVTLSDTIEEIIVVDPEIIAQQARQSAIEDSLRQVALRQKAIEDSIRRIEEKREQYKRFLSEKKKNPIATNFLGGKLGKTSLRPIINRIKRDGFNIEKFGNGYGENYYFEDYICEAGAFLDGRSWNEMRVSSRDGVFYSIELIRDWRKNAYGNQRYFASEVKPYFRNVVSDYEGKYNFWSDGSYGDTRTFNDSTVILTVKTDGAYTVSVQYRLCK